MPLSFNTDTLSIILNHHSSIFSTNEKVIGLRYCSKNKHYLFKSKNEKSYNILEKAHPIEALLKTSVYFSWHKKEAFPFFQDSKKELNAHNNDKGIFEELEKTVLLLKIAPSELNETLYFVIYYDKGLVEYGLSETQDINLTTRVKSFVAQHWYNTISSVLSVAYKDHQTLRETLTPINKNIIEENKKLKNKLINKNEQKSFENLIKSILQQQLPINIHFNNIIISNAALSKLSSFSHQFEQIKIMLQKAIDYLEVIQEGNWEDTVEIEDFLIQTPTIKEENKISISSARMKKISQYLDDLEYAISKTLNSHKKPTLQNIGESGYKKMSAAAISDYIKSNNALIKEAFTEHPLKWSRLKKYCKPIKNISEELERESSKRKQFAI